MPRAGETWCAVSVRFYDDPKMVRAGRDGRDLYLAALCWSVGMETDGLIPRDMLGLLAFKAGVTDVDQAADRLCEVAVWGMEPDGYRIHAFAEWQQTAAQRRAQRAKTAARQQAFRDRKKAESRDTSRVTGALVTSRDGDGDGDDSSLPSTESETAPTCPVDNHEEEDQNSVIGIAMRHAGRLLAHEVDARWPKQYAAEVVRRGTQRVVLEQLAAVYPAASSEWLARRALDLPTDPPPPRACVSCGASAGHRGGPCPEVLADAELAAELRTAESGAS